MTLLKLRKVRALTLLFCIITFTMVLFNYTLRDPSGNFFKYAFRLSGSLFPRGPCGCRRCMAELEDDPWFAERFNQSFHPLMSKKGSALSEDTYRWWQWLQAEKQPANFSEVVDKLFQIIPDKEFYADSGPDRCRTCSVVGNSGNLKDSHYGPLIDASDFVIRMNQAPTEGFEEDVGCRTTHHLMYPESAVDLDNSTSLVLIPFKTLDLEWLISALTTGTITYTYLPVMANIKATKEKVMVYSPSFFKYVYETWLEGHGRYPSTGFLALMFAIHVCDEVRVYGFGADQYGNWHHYWEDNLLGGAFRHTGVHDGDFEYNVTMLLSEKRKIKLFKGS